MEKLSKIACYFRRNRDESRHTSETGTPTTTKRYDVKSSSNASFKHDSDGTTRLIDVIESVLLWENSFNSISVVIVFNILFWGIVVLEVRGFAAASSAALVVVLCYSTLEAQVQRGDATADATVSSRKADRLTKIVDKAKSSLEALLILRRNQPGVFCTGVSAVSIGLWLIGGNVNGVFLTYALCMSILIGPALLLRVPCKVFAPNDLCNEYGGEWESEIEEFLPAVTDDNLEVLQRAGDTGEHTPTSHRAVSEHQIDPLNEDELVGLKMPSHDDGSTDGLDVSELELSPGETETDAIKIQSEHFEPGSSSDEEADLETMSKKLPNPSDDSDSDFEIIDSHEIDDLKTV